MGVHGLWDLIAPVGRRVSVETLSGKKLAIDESIWMVQFMKAMRDEKGEMVRNAHILGFFRRICKLLYLRTKPVFVFDGGTPALKRRTVIARRRQRENAQAKIRKTAEKLLLNQLKAMRLKELARALEDQRNTQKNDPKGKNILSSNPDNCVTGTCDREKLDELLAASIAAEENERLINTSTSAAASGGGVGVSFENELDGDEDEETILSAMDGNVDPAVVTALPESMQANLLGQKHLKNAKDKEILSDQIDKEVTDLEKLDEMLAASLTAEEKKNLTKDASTSSFAYHASEEDWDDDEEMLLPEVHGIVDPAVLAALPPSMQLDLLVQMRERLMAENRQKYQKVKKAPERFSELQIQAYLKTVAFRREIDQVQKAASGKGVGGVQTSRISSEANREFIFSSSFTGDKQLFTSAAVGRRGNVQQQTTVHSSDSVANNAPNARSNSVTGLVLDESTRVFDDDVETYMDERGRTRVSKVRAMGMRMTRDLQRNLDLMKEIEQEQTNAILTPSTQSEFDGSKAPTQHKQLEKSSPNDNMNSANLTERSGKSMLEDESSVQISFEVGDSKCAESDDDIFAELVAEKPIKVSSDSASDNDWEEGIVQGHGNGFSNNEELRVGPSLKESSISEDSEVEWEEGVCNIHDNFLSPEESKKPVSRGYLEEEADLQEAIRRSLEDRGGGKPIDTLSGNGILKRSGEIDNNAVELLDEEDISGGKSTFVNIVPQVKTSELEVTGSEISGLQLRSREEPNPVNETMVVSESCEYVGHSSQALNKEGTLSGEIKNGESVAALEGKETCFMEQSSYTFNEGGGLSMSSELCAKDHYPISKVPSDLPNTEAGTSLLVNKEKIATEDVPSNHFVEQANSSIHIRPLSTKDSENDIGLEEELAGGKDPDAELKEKANYTDQSIRMGSESMPVGLTKGSLEDEILNLGQEYINLEDEQRKLERNAESVSTEMFAECQELLQMFGIPYIIAPMEAEAQCAYMESANLVDGVVTDDSDVFLFGAQSVYKNIFDDRKYVETYFMKDIEKELGLTRDQLIRMALLLGSDYTEGVSGIGIVNAIEVVNAFPEEDGLHKFREWIESPDPTILGKLDAQTGLSERKKGSKVLGNNLSSANNNGGGTQSGQDIPQSHMMKQSADAAQQTKQIFMDKHRNVSKNWHIPSSFPSEAVISAYCCPQVDRSTDPFTWGKPDLHFLRRLCWEKFGWSIQKTDELLVPVLKEYEKREIQLRLEAFYTFNERFAKIRSKRITKAVKGITGNQSSDFMEYSFEEVPNRRKNRKSFDIESEMLSKLTEESVPNYKEQNSDKISSKKSNKRTAREPISFELGSPKQQTQVESRLCTDKASRVLGRGRRRRGRGRGKAERKGGVRDNESDHSSSDVSSGDAEQGFQVSKSEKPLEVRRSTRSRKNVCYALNDVESDDLNELQDQSEYEMSEREEGFSRDQVVSGEAPNDVNVLQQNKDKGPSLEIPSSQYLESGGGFCIHEAEVSKPDVSQGSYPFEADAPKDYHIMGGGFCIREMETGEHQDTAVPAFRETSESSHFSCFTEDAVFDNVVHQLTSGTKRVAEVEETNASTIKQNVDSADASNTDHPKFSDSMTKGAYNNPQVSGIGGLSAMPFLKRKRRKS
ncbi:hypothetical protein K2173_014230 [Erythroxylum novogranatense]|uniref:DNA repair protein UVH3 n=1 Tax=Erythroxylum novogranatense TaxID=1862640 RepID=A0AAV8SEF9_9ROSI|nr:hypothetical protein K2173_014230 [Erythroxylum novogranatense]